MTTLRIAEFVENNQPDIFTHNSVAKLWMSIYGSNYKNSSIQKPEWYQCKDDIWVPIYNVDYMSILIKHTLEYGFAQYLVCLSESLLRYPKNKLQFINNIKTVTKMITLLNNNSFIRGILAQCSELAYDPTLVRSKY